MRALPASLLVCALAAGCSTPVTQDLSRSSPLVRMQLGLCEDYPEETRSLQEARNDLLLLQTNQLRLFRVAFGWDGIEPEPGRYDWSFWDSFVAMAEAHGIQLIPYVCYTPRWASSDPGEHFWRAPPRDPDTFARFMQQVVSRYRGRIRSWELWNEPDNPAYWSGSVEQFATLLKAGSRGVRNADPRAQVVMGGLAWDLEFLDQLLAQPGVPESLDVINLHNYFETWAPDGVEGIDDYVLQADRLVRETGRSMPIWMAELGYSSFRTNGVISKAYQARFDYEHSLRYQGATVFRMLVPLLASGKVSLAAWYRINDLPAEETVIGDVNNRHLGVLDLQRNPKPALAALRFFQELFADGARVLNDRLRVETTVSTDAEIHAFARPDGTVAVIAWLKVITPRTAENTTSTQADPRHERLGIRAPPGTSSATVYDPAGRRIDRLPVNRRTRTASFPLRGGEVYVVVFK